MAWARSRAGMVWRGDDILGNLELAALHAVNETVDEAAADAQATHFDQWQNTPTRWSPAGGQLEESIVSVHARRGARNPTGRFGFTRRSGFYGLFHEEGTSHEFEKPVLRPTADRVFPRLAANIRRRFHP